MKIFVDMDGVIADFVGWVDHIYGDPPELNTPDEWWDYYGQRLKGGYHSSWFWSEMPKTPEADELMDLCKDMGEVCILTNDAGHHGAIEGKQRWIDKWFPGTPVVFTAAKHFLSHTNAVLVDDKESNVIDFLHEGGHAFLVPRPWNTLKGECDVVEILKMYLIGIKQ